VSSGAASWAAQVQTEVLAALDETARVVTAAKAPVLAAHEAAGTWRSPGIGSFEQFRARSTRTGTGATRKELNAARTVTRLDGGLEALTAGTLTPVHAERLATITDKLPEPLQTTLLTGRHARKVTDLAGRLDAARFATQVENMAAALSAAQVEDAHQAARARRHLDLTPTTDGMVRLTGLLDANAGHVVQVALDAASPRPSADDTRSPGQRRADALHALATAALAEPKAGGHSRPHLLITMTAQTFTEVRDHLRADRENRSGDRPGAVVRYQDGPLLPVSELARTLCDSQIARLVVDADSEPLDLGRSTRLFTPAQRRAVIARDGGCAWDGCAMPARYCEVHHLDWWDDDHGHTATRRGALVCPFHHHELHRHHLDLVRHEPDHPPPRPDDPPPRTDDALEHADDVPRRVTYRRVPRMQTRLARESAMRARLLADVRADASERRRRRGA